MKFDFSRMVKIILQFSSSRHFVVWLSSTNNATKLAAYTFYSEHGGTAFLRDVGLWVVKSEKGIMKIRLTTQNETKKCESAFVSNAARIPKDGE